MATMLYADSENLWMPNRVRQLTQRDAARQRISQRIQLKLNTQRGRVGVLGAESGHHRWSHFEGNAYIRGILWMDGSIHTWNGDGDEHGEYAADLDRIVDAFGYKADRDGKADGWGFYVYDGEFSPYHVPEDLRDEVRAVIEAKIGPEFENSEPEPICANCGWAIPVCRCGDPVPKTRAEIEDSGQDLNWPPSDGAPSDEDLEEIESKYQIPTIVAETALWAYPGWTMREWTDGFFQAVCGEHLVGCRRSFQGVIQMMKDRGIRPTPRPRKKSAR